MEGSSVQVQITIHQERKGFSAVVVAVVVAAVLAVVSLLAPTPA
jgi:hypothetical protein